nr:TPA_inf: conotoxin precursor I3 [Conus judaeus]
MKLFLAIVVILMLLSLSTGAETSDNRARSVTALRDRLLRPKSSVCQESGDPCSNHRDCCGSLCCDRECYNGFEPCI